MHILISALARCRALLLFFAFLAAGLWSSAAFAQKGSAARSQDSAVRARQQLAKTAQAERQRALDSAKTARTHALDSARSSRQQGLDSARLSRKTFTDSLQRLRRYRESRRYQDSVAKARQLRLNGARAARMAGVDSARQSRQRVLDSASASRKQSLGALRAVQKRRSDSLATIRKYRESRRYSDSVAVVRKSISDSIREQRQVRIDSARESRKALLTAAQGERKRVLDSAMAVRKKFSDSLKTIRQVRTDSLSKRKAERQKLAKEMEKKKKDKLSLKLQIAMKKKHDAYNNESMLKKRWSFPRRPVQNLFTHYNYYFNANRKMQEAQANMQRIAKDNFEEPIPLFSFNPDRDSSLLASDMDSVILKSSLGIQIHDPRTKWSDDLYLLLGQANYYKGNYDQAQTAFRYIVGTRDRLKTDRQKKAEAAERRRTKTQVISVVEKDKTGIAGLIQHEAATNEALLWLARVLTQSGEYAESDAVIDVLLSDPNTPKDLQGRLALERAFLALKKGERRAAADQLIVVTADRGGIPGDVRRRAAFLAGQLLQSQGRYAEAAAQFDKVTDLNPKIDMDFYARKFKAMNLVAAGGDQSATIASLRRLLNDGKYAAYYEQIYFLLGQSAAVGGKRADAVDYLTKSTQSTKSTRKQKAISFATLGHLYFADGNYDLAKPAYDSASRFAAAAPGDSVVALAVRRASILENVARPSRVIRTQDSLLALAAMSEKEQRAVVRRYLRGLQQAREDSIAAADQAGVNAVAQGGTAEVGASSLSWYFSNATLMQQGYNDFKRRWGNRPLADNWQRAAAVPIAGPTPGANGAPAQDGSNAVNVNDEAARLAGAGAGNYDQNGLPTEAYLLGQIPSTAERQTASRQQVQAAYMALGNAYVRQFEDYPRALATFDTFEARYPRNASGDELAYLRYLVSLRQNNLSAANRYAGILQSQYPSSRWAQQIRPTEDGKGLDAPDNGRSTAAVYEEAYNLLQQRQYGEVLSRVRAVQARADRRYSGGLTIMQAMALAGSANYDQADTVLSMYLQSNPADSLRIWAETVQRYITENRRVSEQHLDSVRQQAGLATGTPGAVASAATTAPANPAAAAPAGAAPGGPAVVVPPTETDTPAVYRYRPLDPHFFVFVFGAVESRVQGVKVALNDFNRLKFPALTLTNSLEPVSPTRGLLFVKGFANAVPAKVYQNAFKNTPALTREFSPGDWQTVLISQSNYLKLMKDRDVAAYLSFYRANYR